MIVVFDAARDASNFCGWRGEASCGEKRKRLEGNNMKSIEFHNREKETKEIRAILHAESSLITFVYGPRNSGKTTMISHLIEELSDKYVVFYVNLRGKFISDYRDFIRVLFKMEREKNYKGNLKTVSEISTEALKFGEIPVEALKMFVSRDEIGMNEVDEVSRRYLVKEKILFVDPLTTVMKPQPRLNLLAIREVLQR